MYTLQNVQWVSVSMDWETGLVLLFLYFNTEGARFMEFTGDTFQETSGFMAKG